MAKKTKKKVAAKKKAPARKKAVAKKAKPKGKTVTATEQVLRIIKGAKEGADVPALMKKTKFDEKKVRNIVSRAFKLKKIQRQGRGVYVGA